MASHTYHYDRRRMRWPRTLTENVTADSQHRIGWDFHRAGRNLEWLQDALASNTYGERDGRFTVALRSSRQRCGEREILGESEM